MKGVDHGEARGVLGHHPIGDSSTLDGAELAAGSAVAAETPPASRADPEARGIVVDGTRIHEAGGSDVEELGAAIASGVAYLRLLSDAGLGLPDAFGQLEFRFAATTDQFLTIAKPLAARPLWAQVATSLGVATHRGNASTPSPLGPC